MMKYWKQVWTRVIAAFGIIIIVSYIYTMLRNGCKVDIATHLVTCVAQASEQYKAEFGTWPASLSNLTNNPKKIVFIKCSSEGLVDPWGYHLIYMPFNSEAGCGLVVSWGADGKLGGTGNNRDRIRKFE